MTKPSSGEELAETADASPTGSTAPEHGGARAAGAAAVLGPRELAAGDVMERYEIVGVLGAGGMGRVYRARDPDLNRDVAIKVLRRTEAGSAGGLERRLLREAQAMAKLTHPNLATVFDVGTVDGEVFIAFEFIDGQTLGAWARAGRTVDERLAALVAAGRGLEAAHSAGVIHRDFKPDNVLVGRDGAVKVVDFGLARGSGEARAEVATASARDELAVDLTVTGSILGTPAYMAPEQHHGNVADARADQFGFAVSAWEVLYGERPFRGNTFTALATAICEGQITPPPSTTQVPAAVETALRKALSVEPDQRYPDMGALLAALAPPPSVAAPRKSIWNDYRVALIAFGVACLAILGVYVGYVTNRVYPKRAAAAVDSSVPPVAESNESFRAAVNELVRTERPRLDECYDIAQAKVPELGAGSVKMNFEIAQTGRVVSTRIYADDFNGEHGIASCVAALTMAWTFPTPPGGAGASMSLGFDFKPRVNEITRDGDTFTISRATWDSWSASPGYLSRGLNPVKSEANGKQIGYRLFGIKPGSIQNQLGFEAGDLVTHINDRALDSERAFLELAPALDGSKPIVIRLNRRGAPLTLTYRIAPAP